LVTLPGYFLLSNSEDYD